MRRLWILLFPLTLQAGALPAQAGSRWTIGLGITWDAFSGASSDTTSLSGTEVEVVPAPRLALEAGLSRAIGKWEIRLAGGYAAGALRARTDALILDDRTGNVRRYRLALHVGRRMASLGAATLHVTAGPSLDHWTATGIGNRTTLGGRLGLVLRVPLGGVTLENTVRFGLSGSPFRQRDLPPEANLKSLRSWSVGAGLVVPL
jgi:hypothetical protein